MQVLTVTMNPAVDLFLHLDDFKPGTVNRARTTSRIAGGKGVNVSCFLSQLGIASVATGFLGEENAELHAAALANHGIADAFIRIAGETRTGVKILDDGLGQTTDINLPGLTPSKADLDALRALLSRLAQPQRWVVFAGSLPTGVSVGFLVEMIELVKKQGALVAVDTSGPALRGALECGVALAKPNAEELGEVDGCELATIDQAAQAAARWQQRGIAHMVVSMGEQGAIFAAPDGTCHAQAEGVAVVGTVGAGDALLAGYLAGLVEGKGLEQRARRATACAWAVLEDTHRILPRHTRLAKYAHDVRVCIREPMR